MLRLLATLLLVPGFTWAEPSTEVDFSKITEPPLDAVPAGQKRSGVQIGLWTEKPVYDGTEIRNV